MEKKTYVCEKDILCGIHRPDNNDQLTELEEKHMPVIDAPEKIARGQKTDVTVKVGHMRAHPNEPGHFIEWIELYCGDTFVWRASFAGSQSHPSCTIPVLLSHARGPLRARVKCNLHGLWEAEKPVTVE